MEGFQEALDALEKKLEDKIKKTKVEVETSLSKKIEKTKVPVDSVGKAEEKEKPTIPKKTVEITFKEAGKKERKGTFAMKVPSVNLPEFGGVLTATEVLDNEAALVWLAENTLVNRKSVFIKEVF